MPFWHEPEAMARYKFLPQINKRRSSPSDQVRVHVMPYILMSKTAVYYNLFSSWTEPCFVKV